MASSPTPSVDSIPGTHAIELYTEHNGYLSDSPLTLSGSSPPVSDSAICDEFTSAGSANSSKQHHPISASVSSSSSASSSSSSSSSSSTSSSSGVSGCGSTSSGASNGGPGGTNNGPGVIGSNLSSSASSSSNGGGSNSSGKGSPCNALLSSGSSLISVGATNVTGASHCTACKSKQSDAVAKCFECVSYLCDSCDTAHRYMHCFNGHHVCRFKSNSNSTNNNGNGEVQNYVDTNVNNTVEFKFSSSLTMMLQQQQQQQQHQQQQHQQQQQQLQLQKQPLSQLSKIVLNSHAASTAAAAAAAVFSSENDHHHSQHQQQQQQQERHNGDTNMFGALMTPPMRLTATQQFFCHRHKHELLKFSCRTCCTLVCKECVVAEHSSGLHEVELVQEHGLSSAVSAVSNPPHPPESVVQSVLAELRGKVGEIVSLVNNQDNNVSKLKLQYQKAHNDVNETYQFFRSMLDERKQDLVKELEGLYNAKIASNGAWLQRSKEIIEKAVQTCDAIERAPKAHSVADVLMLRKTLELQLHAALQDIQLPFELEFMSNYQSIQAGVRNTFGYIRPTNTTECGANVGNGGILQKQPPIARPTQSSSNGSSASSNSQLPGGLGLSAVNLLDNNYATSGSTLNGTTLLTRNGVTHHQLVSANGGNTFEELMPKRYQSGVVSASPYVGVPVNPYEKWSNGGSENIFSTGDPFSSAQLLNSLNANVVGNGPLSALNVTTGSVSSGDSLMDLTSKLLSANSTYPPKSQIKRQKMIYHCKFGEFGVLEGQFTEPSGVAVNAQNDIIVADTNNHRIQIFDKEGRFKFQFGECGKRDSQLLYPNRVAVVRTSGDIIVTERSPTHQIQIYNQYGQFVRKFGANILQHPRGVTVDNKGRIIVVECKVMRVIIFDQNGSVLHKFGCSKHLEFPNGVVVNDKQEIFISDNRAHCVKVFNYEGQYLRQIGGEGVTNYPIGVGINANGEILIADNHNNFNLTIFTQDGQLVSALESKVKHAQCFDVALMDDGSVVLASKDYRLYIYRYVQVPPVIL